MFSSVARIICTRPISLQAVSPGTAVAGVSITKRFSGHLCPLCMARASHPNTQEDWPQVFFLLLVFCSIALLAGNLLPVGDQLPSFYQNKNNCDEHFYLLFDVVLSFAEAFYNLYLVCTPNNPAR